MGRSENRYHSGGNFYHTFLESRHPGFLKKFGWTCQSGSLIGENALPWQPGVKFWQMHLIQNVISQQPVKISGQWTT